MNIARPSDVPVRGLRKLRTKSYSGRARRYVGCIDNNMGEGGVRRVSLTRTGGVQCFQGCGNELQGAIQQVTEAVWEPAWPKMTR
eukprot:11193917-Lingulodinium_polyedra.AAC.1